MMEFVEWLQQGRNGVTTFLVALFVVIAVGHIIDRIKGAE